MLNTVIQDVASFFGVPLVVRRSLSRCADALISSFPCPAACIASDSVVSWEGLSEAPWSDRAPRETVQTLVATEVIDWQCDIRQVDGLSASKAPLEAFATLDQFALHSCASELAKGLDACLQHCRSRIASGDRYPLSVAQWDGRLFVENSDGSHHFAAARYIAGQEKRRIELPVRLRRSSFDPDALAKLRRRYEVFAVRGPRAFAIWEALGRFEVRIERADAPRQVGEDTELWFLARGPRAEKAAMLLRGAGALDVGRHLQDLAGKPLPHPSTHTLA